MTDMGRVKSINSIFTLDNVIFGFDGQHLKVLLIERGEDPHRDKYALPGDFVRVDETIDDAAGRVLNELTGLENVYLDQFHTYGAVDRHPWGRIISIAYFSLIKLIDEADLKPASFARSAKWFAIDEIPELAFDHNTIIDGAYHKLRVRSRLQPVGFELLPQKFTLRELQNLYEAILRVEIDKRNFRRKILKMNIVIALDEKQVGVAHKAAQFYKFDKEKYEELREKGFTFDLINL